MFEELEDLLKANCLSQDPEGLRDFGMSSDGKVSAFSLRVVGFLVDCLFKVSLFCWITEATFLAAAWFCVVQEGHLSLYTALGLCGVSCIGLSQLLIIF